MLIKNEVMLHQNSVDYVKEAFSRYVEVDRMPEDVTNPIVHIYPKEDTYNTDGELNGYIDSLFSEIHIYDTKNKTVWKSKRFHDGLEAFDDIYISQIKAFKDLSMMIALRGKYHFGIFQAITIKRLNN